LRSLRRKQAAAHAAEVVAIRFPVHEPLGELELQVLVEAFQHDFIAVTGPAPNVGSLAGMVARSTRRGRTLIPDSSASLEAIPESVSGVAEH
jgi:hypothetical protein